MRSFFFSNWVFLSIRYHMFLFSFIFVLSFLFSHFNFGVNYGYKTFCNIVIKLQTWASFSLNIHQLHVLEVIVFYFTRKLYFYCFFMICLRVWLRIPTRFPCDGMVVEYRCLRLAKVLNKRYHIKLHHPTSGSYKSPKAQLGFFKIKKLKVHFKCNTALPGTLQFDGLNFSHFTTLSPTLFFYTM